jgi:hypothetical protein
VYGVPKESREGAVYTLYCTRPDKQVALWHMLHTARHATYKTTQSAAGASHRTIRCRSELGLSRASTAPGSASHWLRLSEAGSSSVPPLAVRAGGISAGACVRYHSTMHASEPG